MKKIRPIIENLIFALKYVNKIDSKFIYILFLTTFLSAIDSIYSIIMLKVILDVLILNNINIFIKVLLILLMLSFLLDSLLKYLQDRIIVLKKVLIEQGTNLDIFQAVANIDLIEYDNTENYDAIFFNLSLGFETLINLLQNFSSLFGKILSIFGMISIIGNYDFNILLIIAIFVIVNSCINFFNAKLNFTKSYALIPSLRGIDYIRRVFYLKQYAAEIRIFRLEKILKSKYKAFTNQKYGITKKYINYEFLLSSIQVLFQLIMQFIIIVLLGLKYIAKKIRIGDFLVVFNSIIELNEYITSVIDTFPEFYKNSLYINEFRKLINTKQELIQNDINNVKVLELSNINFSYRQGNSILKNFNLKLKAGSSYAIIGSNGTGKSTLLKIIAGLYNIENGSISINGKELKNKKLLTNFSSINFQDHQFYALSIAENILNRTCKTTDEEKIWEILQKVGLYERVISLPKGIHTVISQELDEDGTTFSGGEMQRLAIARTLMHLNDIMIFDEPTSALDPISITNIIDLILDMTRDKILIYVTHNLDNLNKFDEVIKLD